MSIYKITEAEEQELKEINNDFESLEVPSINPPHNDAPEFDLEEHKKRAKESSELALDMWESITKGIMSNKMGDKN